MDARALAELELLEVARMYGLDTVVAPAPAAAQSSVAPAPAGAQSPAATASWEELREQVAQCRACGLCKQRKQAVFGVGAQAGPWLFVGEGPGADEDEQGEPFVGQAGKLLDNMLAAIGCRRGQDSYIANVVKCRPPGNRTPTAEEAAACAPFLDRQIDLVAPKLIVALGKSAIVRLLQTDAAVASLRGRVHRYRGIPVVVTYHPAYLLRSLPEKAKAWEDLLLARRTISAT
jgi:uracil-DNA glycosylase